MKKLGYAFMGIEPLFLCNKQQPTNNLQTYIVKCQIKDLLIGRSAIHVQLV